MKRYFFAGPIFGVAPPPPPVEGWDVVPAPVFFEGSTDSYDIAATGPIDLGYTPRGTYSVDTSGQPLPAGMTLSSDGLLSVGTAGPGIVSGVVFKYTEPASPLPILTLYSNTFGGTLPYLATVFAPEAAVPAGSTIVSDADTSLRASILNTSPDGSAPVLVVAGHKTGIIANSSTQVSLRAAVQADTPLTTADIASKFTSGITVNFSGTPQTLNSWGSPDRIWWANSQVICARYRLSCGLGVMEAVIDVHAFAQGRAFVEIVIENSRFDAAVATPTRPTYTTYTNATISVNDTIVLTANPPLATPWPEILRR